MPSNNNDDVGPQDPELIPQDLLKKFITYAKVKCTPKMHNTDYDKIAQVYAELRREAAVTHSMPIAVRHLESIIRMSEAHARMHLREYINSDDIDTAIRCVAAVGWWTDRQMDRHGVASPGWQTLFINGQAVV